eukprot:13108951-Heterocapsa_arctica.AAC.1
MGKAVFRLTGTYRTCGMQRLQHDKHKIFRIVQYGIKEIREQDMRDKFGNLWICSRTSFVWTKQHFNGKANAYQPPIVVQGQHSWWSRGEYAAVGIHGQSEGAEGSLDPHNEVL